LELGFAARTYRTTQEHRSDLMTFQKIKVSQQGDVALITLADPATLNAIGPDMASELLKALKHAASAPTRARAILLTGEGRGFCSGANLVDGGAASKASESAEAPDLGDALATVYNPLVTFIRNLSVPLVTAVNGAAAGIGCSLALMGDIVVAADSAYFLQAFRRIGLIPDGGPTYILPRLIGKARAMEMALLGERVLAAKALEWGLVNRVAPDAELMPTAMAIAEELAKGPASLALIRQTMWAALDAEWNEQLYREQSSQTIAGLTADFAEGVSAFQQKRPAVFSGR
jgi:2-(1,2-epoxy-1,2-dihydrophenyl)acetyl-CoA isomerase